MNKFYTAQEVADKLKIKKTTVYELIKRGELSSSKIGKQLRVSEEQLAQYLDGAAQISTAAQTRDYQPESSLLKRDYLLHSSGLIISGQSSPALDLLLNQLPSTPGSLPVLQSHMNTYNGLYSLYFEKVHLACAAASPEDIKSLVPGVSLTAIRFCQYPVGFYVKKENPRNIRDFSDLTRADIIFANREKGSSRRVLLDRQLKFHRKPYPDTATNWFPTIPPPLPLPVDRLTPLLAKAVLPEVFQGLHFFLSVRKRCISSCVPKTSALPVFRQWQIPLHPKISGAPFLFRPDMIPHIQEKLSPCNYLMVCVHIFIYSG